MMILLNQILWHIRVFNYLDNPEEFIKFNIDGRYVVSVGNTVSSTSTTRKILYIPTLNYNIYKSDSTGNCGIEIYESSSGVSNVVFDTFVKSSLINDIKFYAIGRVRSSDTGDTYHSYLRVDNDEDAIGGQSMDGTNNSSLIPIDDGCEPIKVLSADQSGLTGNVKEIFIFPNRLGRYNAPGEPYRCTINFHLSNEKMKKTIFHR